MDVNGTRLHVVRGTRDWRSCRVEAGPSLIKLDSTPGPLHYNEKSEQLTLSSKLPLFTDARGRSPLDVSSRRGAAPDSFGNWYWISNDRRRIYWLPAGGRRPGVYWAQETAARCPTRDAFIPSVTEQPIVAELAGLAVTEHHYLVVGNVTESGLFVFDLHAGGDPMMLIFPEGVNFEPFDFAPAPGGGVWMLDRRHKSYWGLDRHFRVISDVANQELIAPESEFQFHPVGSPAVIHPKCEFPNSFAIAANDPVSIEALPDGSVLILDRIAVTSPMIPGDPVSQILRYLRTNLASPPLVLADDIDVVSENAGKGMQRLNLVAHDIAFARDILYVVESEGNQTLAFDLNIQEWPARLKLSTDFLPMYYFGSRGLVAAEGKISYDVVGGDGANDALVNWVELQVVEQPQYEREGTLHTPPLDGKERDCVWHRIFIDACIPAETSVQVWTRAHNDLELLEIVPFDREPDLYLRGAGPELPFFKAFPGREVLPERTGTWEVLFQRANGRFLEIKLVIGGNGRTTPHLHTLRAYCPRFSYPKQYLPDIYLDDVESASFLERMLANLEGFFTDIEGKINDVSMLFDARSAPPESLQWLAGWLGLLLDPLWGQIQQKRQVARNSQGGSVDRRRLVIRFARTLYERRGTPSGILFALHLLLDPCLEETLRRFKNIALERDTNRSLREELRKLTLASPTSAWSEQQFENLLYDYLLAPQRTSSIRLVERYRTRGGRAKVAGDPTQANDNAPAASAPDAFAHNFSVLVPEGLSAEEAAMVERLTNLEKPAHTAFDVRRFWDFFRVGETRLGIDTVLGEESRFQKIVMGRSYLAAGYLYPSHPMDVKDRVVANRDRVGQLPAL